MQKQSKENVILVPLNNLLITVIGKEVCASMSRCNCSSRHMLRMRCARPRRRTSEPLCSESSIACIGVFCVELLSNTRRTARCRAQFCSVGAMYSMAVKSGIAAHSVTSRLKRCGTSLGSSLLSVPQMPDG